jgi:Fe-S cluster biosynthesis and repair protein YggX
MSDETIHCQRCDADAPKMPRAPFRNELGERIHLRICADCWKEWLQHQTLLINHYGLDPRDSKARAFLYEQIEQVLLGDGSAKQVDTSKQGSVEW